MAVSIYPSTKRNVLEYLKKHIPELETLGVKTFGQLQRLIEDREELDCRVPHVDPVPPPERPVRVIHAGHTVKVPKAIVVVDTREQDGFAYDFGRFAKWFAGVERATLRAGDYSVKGMEHRLAIERKSLADLVNSVIGDRTRFLAQCKRLAALERKAIVIEASLAEAKSFYPESQAHPNAVVGTLMAIQERWGIQILWCDTAELAEETVAHMLSKHYTLQWLKAHRLPRQLVVGQQVLAELPIGVRADSRQRRPVDTARVLTHEEGNVVFRANRRLAREIQRGDEDSALDLLAGVHVRNIPHEQVIRFPDRDIVAVRAQPA